MFKWPLLFIAILGTLSACKVQNQDFLPADFQKDMWIANVDDEPFIVEVKSGDLESKEEGDFFGSAKYVQFSAITPAFWSGITGPFGWMAKDKAGHFSTTVPISEKGLYHRDYMRSLGFNLDRTFKWRLNPLSDKKYS